MPSLLGKSVPDVTSRIRREKVNFNVGGVSEKNTQVMPIRPRKDSSEAENHASQPARPGRLRSKPKAIMKMISTTLWANASPSEPGCVPAPASDLASKANREAALRARGLLPPLKPNKDLSRLEQEQDQHLPAINLADETLVVVEGDVTKTTTAANLVKQEWEAKNRPDPSRMNNFKFGGLPSPAPSLTEQTATSTELHTVVVGDDPSLSPTEGQQVADRPDVSTNPPTPPPLVFDRHAMVASDSLLSPQSPATPYENDPHLIPLPPSPLPSPQILPASPTRSADSEHAQIAAPSVPLSPPSDLPGAPRSLRSTSLISLSSPPPARSHNESITFMQPHFFSESESSDTAPSLDNSSQTMTVSSLGTSESLPSTGKAKMNTLKVKVLGHNIPMIAESPIEETSKDSLFSPNINHEPSSAEKRDEQPSASPEVRQGQTPTPSPSVVDNKQSTNPVKRGQSLDPSSSVVAKNRLSVLSSIRRSVVGSISRSKSAFIIGENKKTFNASHLPPSPTLPASFAEQARKFSPTRSLFPSPRDSDAGSIQSVSRVAAAPMIYSRGGILNEVKNIKDEETRRVTELAFLG